MDFSNLSVTLQVKKKKSPFSIVDFLMVLNA